MRCNLGIALKLYLGIWILVGVLFNTPAQAVPNAPTIVQIEGKTVIGGQTLYLNQTTNLTVVGNAEADKTIKIRNGATQIATTTANGAGAYSVDINLGAGTHSLSAVANDVTGDSSPSSIATILIDITAPNLSLAYFRNVGWETLGIPSQIMLRFGLGSVMQADVSDSGGSSLDFTTATIALYDLGPWNALYGSPLQIAGTSANDGSSRITFVPNNTADAGKNGYKYRSVVTIRDRSGNLSSETAEWFRDDTPPAAPTITHIYDPSVGSFLPYTPGMNIGGQPIKIRGTLSPRGNYLSQPPDGFNGYSVVGALHESHWTNCTVLGGTTSAHGSTINAATGEYTIDYPSGDPNYIFTEGSQNVYVDSVDTAMHRTRTNITLNFNSGAPPAPSQPTGYNGAELRVGPSLDFPMTYPAFSGLAGLSPSLQTVCIYQAEFYSFPVYNYNNDYKVCQQVRPNGQSYSSTAGYDIGDAFADKNNNWVYDVGEEFTNSVTSIPGYPTSNGRNYYLPNVRNLATPLGESLYIGIGSANTVGESVKQRVARLHYNTGLPQLQSLLYSPVDAIMFSSATKPSQITARVRTSGEDWCPGCHGLDTSYSKITIINNGGSDVSAPRTTTWSYTGSNLVYNGSIDLSSFSPSSGTYTVRLDLRDNMLNTRALTNNTFKLDYGAPIAQNITPGNGTVSSIPSFNADMVDPPLADGTTGTGVSLDPTENQIDAYRVLGQVTLGSGNTTLTAPIDSPIGGQAVDHRGTPIPASPSSLPAGAAVQIWDITGSPATVQIMGMPTATGNSTTSNATVTVNSGGNITVTSSVGSLPGGRTYAIMYLIPHFDSNDGTQKLAAVPTQPAIAAGPYASRMTARDRVGNVGTTVSTTVIRMDPPTGTIGLNPSALDVYIMTPAPGNRSTVTSSVIQGASGTIVPDGTLVTLAVSGPGFLVEGDANGIAADGHQIATAANGAGPGTIRFNVQAQDTTTTGVVTISASIGSATGNTTVTMRRPNLSVTKTSDSTLRTPGQTITYTLSYSNSGNSAANNVTLRDRLPAGVTYVANSLRLNGTLQNNDAGLFNASQGPSGQINFPLGALTAGSNGNITFQVTVN